MLTHPIPPTYNKTSKILILGSFPSVLSRKNGYFYGHPKNRFWTVLAKLFEEEKPSTNEEKEAFLLRNHIAVWDVIASCDIKGSADSTIENVKVNEIEKLLRETEISKIFVNGKKAEELYQKYVEEKTGKKAIYLPSTSPANAVWSIEKLVQAWEMIKD